MDELWYNYKVYIKIIYMLMIVNLKVQHVNIVSDSILKLILLYEAIIYSLSGEVITGRYRGYLIWTLLNILGDASKNLK